MRTKLFAILLLPEMILAVAATIGFYRVVGIEYMQSLSPIVFLVLTSSIAGIVMAVLFNLSLRLLGIRVIRRNGRIVFVEPGNAQQRHDGEL